MFRGDHPTPDNEAARPSEWLRDWGAMAEWVSRQYSKGEIDRAGDFLVPWWLDQAQPTREEVASAYVIVENWRTCHAYPLNAFQVNLRARARRVEKDALVAQRLKRFSSMMNKLARESSMKLSQMQDLGGCRAIMSSVQAVEDVLGLYRGAEDGLFPSEQAPKIYDYLRHPKRDGYRGVHIVGRFSARGETRQQWNGQRIEVQLRSRLQHAFATAVETVTTFTREPLKFGGGPDEWRRFFSLMGSALAIREGTILVEDTPSDPDELVRELSDSARALQVSRKLRGWATALRAIPRRHMKGAKWLLMVLDLRANTVSVIGFPHRERAASELARIEQRPGLGDHLDAVLVWVPYARHLRATYPNYYADTREFLNALQWALTKKGRGRGTRGT